MKRTLIATAVITALAAVPVHAAPDVHETHHAGMPLQLAQAGTPPAGQPMGPGMMGQGMGPGMMGQGYGPGMMGQGMGPGMMGGMMGPGMMYGANPYAALDLSAEQRAKIADIQQDLWRKRWALMGKMHEERYAMHRWMSGAAPDDAAARKAYEAMAEAHKQMFEATLEARTHIDAVLTQAQRDKLKQGG